MVQHTPPALHATPRTAPRRPSCMLRDERGSVTAMFLISSVVVLGASFGAMDLVRYNVVQGRMQNALDGATLSAGRNLANLTPTPGTIAADQWKEDAFQYFRANLPDGYLGSNILPEDLKIEYSEEITGEGNYRTGQFIEMEVKGDLPLLSTGFFNISSFEVQARNQALRRTRSDLEVVMALDNTGSMSGSKLSTLKTAAKNLSSTVLGASEASGVPGRVFVGLVPFADTVNVGNNAQTRLWLDYPPAQTRFINSFWMGCIAEPSAWGGNNLPAAALTPASGFQPLHLTLRTQITNLNLANSNNNYERIAPDTAQAPQPREFNANGADYDRRVWARRSSNTSFEVFNAANPANCRQSRLVRFLNDDLDSINDAIDDMEADGNTLIPTGLLWAWRMLHPAWRGAQGWGDAAKPRDPEPRTLSKVIVLLTDGENQPPSTVSTASNSERRVAYRLNYDAQRCANSQRTNCNSNLLARSFTQSSTTLGDVSQAPMNSLKMRDPFTTNTGNSQNAAIGWGNNSNISTATVNNYLSALCANVKSDGNGIKIYTVTLGSVGGSTETLMNHCSSGAGYFYNAANVNDLPEVFRSIAGALTELRLTK